MISFFKRYLCEPLCIFSVFLRETRYIVTQSFAEKTQRTTEGK